MLLKEKHRERRAIHLKGETFIPKTLRERIIRWYHTYLVHPERTRMEATIRQNSHGLD